MTYYGRAINEHVDLTMAVLVEGIPYAFVERTVAGSPAAIGTRTQVVCVTRVEEGESTLSHEDRRETAATLDVEVLDTADNLLRTLFAAGTRATTWVNANATAAATTVFLDSTAAMTEEGHIYIGAETLLINAIMSATELDVARGQFSSTAAPVNGGASDGDAVYLVPPFWRGRRVSLYGYTTQGDETLLGVFIVDESPRHTGDRAWAIRCAGIVQEYFERSVGVGLEPQTTTGAVGVWTNGTPQTYEIPVTRAASFQTSPSGWPSYVIVNNPTAFGVEGGQTSIVELLAVDTVSGTITLAVEGAFGTRGLQAVDAIGPPIGWGVRQIGVLQAPGAASILVALLSDEGQELSGGDYLPGRPASSSEDFGWRLGAGFGAVEVDSAAFDAITAVPPMTTVIDGERKVTDLLREWCLLTGTAIVSTVDGKLKPITMAAQRASTARTLTSDDIVPESRVEVEHDESGIFPLVTIRAGYSPLTGEFHDEINMIDVELAKRYRRTPQRREIDIRAFDVWTFRTRHQDNGGWRHPSRILPADLITMINDTMRGDGALARRFVRLSLTQENLDLRIGDTVILSATLQDAFSSLPDMRGSTIAGVTCRVVSRRPRYDQGRVDVRLEIMDRLLHVCPAAVIASAAGATLTLATTGPEVSGVTPTDDFYVGAEVTVIDRSNAAASETHGVQSITSGTILVLDAVPGFAIAGGTDYIVLSPSVSPNGTTASGYSTIEFAALADDDGTATGTGTAHDTTPRWR